MELHEWSEKLFGFRLHQRAHHQLKDHFIPHKGNGHKPHIVHHRALFLYSAFLILLKVAVVSLPILYPFSQAQSLAVTPENIIELTNESREDFGLDALILSPKLSVAAANKARDMMDVGYFAHFSPDGVSPWFWFEQAKYDYSFAGENLAIRFNTAEGVTAAWLSSPAHKANILSADFSEIGVAVLNGDFGDEGLATLVVQMFGTPGKKQGDMEVNSMMSDTNYALPEISDFNLETNSDLSAPEILFPLSNSFVNKSVFKVMVSANPEAAVQIFFDEKMFGEIFANKNGRAEFLIPEELALSEGVHVMFAALVSGDEISSISDPVRFTVDTTPPAVDAHQFSMIPSRGSSEGFDVSAWVDKDSIRTLASVGADSSSLTRETENIWTGELIVYNITEQERKPVEVFAQDLAGNENKKRVGYMQRQDVKGVFSFVSQESDVGKQAVSFFGGTVNFDDFEKSAMNFYLYFVVFLASALILKIAIARHIQHPKTIVGSAGVMMLAMMLFVV